MTKRAHPIRKRATRRRAPRARRVTIVRPIIEKRRTCKLTYESGNVGGAPTTVTPGVYQFRSNGIFDPDFTGTGHQPRGRDELALLYKNYIVHGVMVTVFAQSLTANNQSIVSIYPHSGATTLPDVRSLIENPDTKYCMFTPDKPCRLTKYVSNPRLFSVSKQRYRNEATFSAGMGGDPGATTTGYITINWINLNESTSTGHTIRVKLEYYVELYDPVVLTAS